MFKLASQQLLKTQRNFLLSVLWKKINFCGADIQDKLYAFGHEECVVCNRTGKAKDGSPCVFGDPEIHGIKNCIDHFNNIE